MAVERVRAIDVAEFERGFLDANRPVVLLDAGVDGWRIKRHWVTPDGEINWPYLLQEYGHLQVPVRHAVLPQGTCERSGRPSESGFSPTSESATMTLAEFKRTQWRASSDPKPYLKDWHACLDLNDAGLFRTPLYFRDDWLNDWLSTKPRASDYRFVYLGPVGSRTGVHIDVVHSNSWSAQVAGCKRWLLLEPSKAHLVEGANGICCVESFPEDVRPLCIEVIQSPGEIIFVPSGWYHCVENLTDSLSANVNWVDSASLRRSWNHLLKEYRIAEHYIEDLKPLTGASEFARLVDRNAKLQCGMNKADFLEMVQVVMGIEEKTDMDSIDLTTEANHLRRRRTRYGQEFLAWSRDTSDQILY